MLTNRRNWIQVNLAAVGAALLPRWEWQEGALPSTLFRHSVCRWCFNSLPLEELCDKVKELGLQSVELLGPKEWPVALSRGLDCAVATAPWISLTDGFNDPKNHGSLQEKYRQLMRQAADAGLKQVICFSGNRKGLDDAAGLEHCAKGLAPLVKEAEQLDIRLIMELLNSKKDHPGHQCDNTPWGVALVNKIGSTHFKLLYDIYHMQVMEGDIIQTIRSFSNYIAHYHTAGVPGRHEIDHSQELNYPAIMRAIAQTGFDGYVGQEFIPTINKPLESLKKAVHLCSV